VAVRLYIWLAYDSFDRNPLRIDSEELGELISRTRSVGCAALDNSRRATIPRWQVIEVAEALAKSIEQGQPPDQWRHRGMFGTQSYKWQMTDDRVRQVIAKLKQVTKGMLRIFVAYDVDGHPVN
jgi:hypothetical protein